MILICSKKKTDVSNCNILDVLKQCILVRDIVGIKKRIVI